MTSVLRVGALAPDFTVTTDTGESFTLSDLRGRVLVLYFYPKDNTEGCTAEACEFRDLFPKFKRNKAVVLGISPDSARKHENFRKKYNLPFTLLADDGHVVAERYGLWIEKLFWGRKYMGVARTTYIIGPEGRIKMIFPNVEITGHAEAVASVLKTLG